MCNFCVFGKLTLLIISLLIGDGDRGTKTLYFSCKSFEISSFQPSGSNRGRFLFINSAISKIESPEVGFVVAVLVSSWLAGCFLTLYSVCQAFISAFYFYSSLKESSYYFRSMILTSSSCWSHFLRSRCWSLLWGVSSNVKSMHVDSSLCLELLQAGLYFLCMA